MLSLQFELLEVVVWACVGLAVEGEQEGAFGCALHGRAGVSVDGLHLESWVERQIG